MWENYTKLKKIGEGPNAEVWLVFHLERRTLYAGKYLVSARKRDYARFRRELEALRQLNHENVVKIIDIPDEGEPLGFVMEYCPNGNILDMSKEKSPEEILELICILADAVDYIHTKGYVHRDLKPENILVSADDKLRVCDFGLVIGPSSDHSAGATSTWVSPGFTAPEQYHDMMTVTQKGDIFSIGAILFHLLTHEKIMIGVSLDSQLSRFKGVTKFLLGRTLCYDARARLQEAKTIRRSVLDFKQYDLGIYFDKPRNEREQFISDGGNPALKTSDPDDWLRAAEQLKAISEYEENESLGAAAKKMSEEINDAAWGRISDAIRDGSPD
jgi:serine/threonine protein kinase